MVAEAFHVATTGRPGPVLIDIPKDIANSRMEWYWPEPSDLDLPGYRPMTDGDPALIREAAELLLAAERPIIYAGGGILKARAADALRELAERTGIPVVTTLMARGSFPDSHPLCLGMPGMHGNYTAVTAMQRSDLLIALGSRFDDRVTGKIDAFAPEAKVIHVDIDPAELHKVRRADVAIAGDCRLVIEELLVALEASGLPPLRGHPGRVGWGAVATPWPVPGRPRYRWPTASPGPLIPWRAQLSEWQRAVPPGLRPAARGRAPSSPSSCSRRCATPPPRTPSSPRGSGQHQMFASQWWQFDHPYTWVNSGGSGTMGFAVPAAIGAKVGRPDKMVWAVDGDGCFQMTAQELVTASSERIPVKIAILNNAYLGMVRQWQEMFYEERYSEVYLSPDLPDYVGWAESMGCVGIRVESPEEVAPAIDKANSIDDRPVVVDFRTDAFEKVFPMVAAGASERRHRGRPVPDRGEPDEHVRNRQAPPHPDRPGGEQVRCAGPGGRPVLPAWLQHLQPGRRPVGQRAVQPDHHRGRRGVGTPRPDHEAARQADPGGLDHRARSGHWPASGSCSSPPWRPVRSPGARSSSWSGCSRARSSTSATTASP